ncbi:MAG: hypothetical protein ABSE69_01320 [Roseiarcus sp.]|jgi:hypothetical protein
MANRRLQFPCLTRQKRAAAKTPLFRPLKKLDNFERLANISKILFGGIEGFQRLAREKIWKCVFSGIPVRRRGFKSSSVMLKRRQGCDGKAGMSRQCFD